MWSTANKLMMGLTGCVCIAQMYFWFDRLPDPVPSHFNGAGQVDGQMSKVPFYAFIGLMHALFLIGFPLLGVFIKRLPNSIINLPNKEYWLAPERRDETLSTNSRFLAAIGWMTSWLIIAIFQLTADVAVKLRETINPEFYWILGIYLVVLFSVVTLLCWKFRLPTVESDRANAMV